MKEKIIKLYSIICVIMTSLCFVHADVVNIIRGEDGKLIFLDDSHPKEVKREQQITPIIIAVVIVLIVVISFIVLKHLNKKNNENKNNDEKIEEKK